MIIMISYVWNVFFMEIAITVLAPVSIINQKSIWISVWNTFLQVILKRTPYVSTALSIVVLVFGKTSHISWITFWIKKQNTSIDHRRGCPNNSFAKLYITIPIFLLCSFFLFFGLSRFLIGLTPPPNFRLASYATVKILYKIRVINNKAGVIKSAWSWFYKDTCNLPVFLFVDQLNDMHH